MKGHISKRRAEPTPTQNRQQPTPQPSIKSSQMFNAHQQGMHTQGMQQGQQGQQGMQGMQNQGSQAPKISISDAIALICVRLGVIETKFIALESGGLLDDFNPQDNVHKSALESVLIRLDSLERTVDQIVKQPTSSTNTDTLVLKKTVDLLKKELDTLKKNKNNNDEITTLKNELAELRQLVVDLTNLSTSFETEENQENHEDEEIQEVQESQGIHGSQGDRKSVV